MNRNKYILLSILTLSFILSWDWPWQSKESDVNENIITLPKGTHQVLSDISNVTWKGQKAVGGSHTGNINIKDSEIIIDKNGNIFGSVIIDMKTINCTDLEGELKSNLEGHLKSGDFFGVENHKISKIEFKSTEKDGNKINFSGDLTIKEITHPITFSANLIESQNKIVANTSLVFDRSKYDVRYGSGSFFENLGDNLILDNINIGIVLAINK
jgi:polyisoprenoid-binding protein YceI|tara:strand:- start:204 stop:842 length:639 start_codon:yes stop_codon:yes gene_type:complete